MTEATLPKLTLTGCLLLGAIAALALVLRLGYLHLATDHFRGAAELAVQGTGPRLPLSHAPTDAENLIENLAQDDGWFGGLAPLATHEEKSAHIAPCYPWIRSVLVRLGFSGDRSVRAVNLAWGIGAVVFLFLAARRWYDLPTAVAVGLLAAIYPFWIINVAEKADGGLIVFWFAASAWLAVRSVQTGEPTTCLAFGLSIGLTALTRAALLPFAVVGMLWFLSRCRHVKFGWFASLLASLGFCIAIGPWMLRCWKEYEKVVPVADSALLHVYIGNNPWANGGPMDEAKLRSTFSADRLEVLRREKNQARRYAMLADNVGEFWRDDPRAALSLRYAAFQRFLFGEKFIDNRKLVERDETARALPDSLERRAEFILLTSLLSLWALGLLGWVACRGMTGFLTAALFAIPLPYVLSHAETLSGPRLPWDAALIVFAGAALAKLWPGRLR
ncbi:MAG: glycosyltransferase family 39 protein [Gemmataceae bacterium]|nr:glycosyltransferase family 39 protein [Gemmataceae bacterium]